MNVDNPLWTAFHADDRVAIFIDGANVWHTMLELNQTIDYGRLVDLIKMRCRLVHALYYTAVPVDPEEYSTTRPLLDWLSYNGFILVTKPLKDQGEDAAGRRKLKGNLDVEIAVDMVRLAPYLDHAILFSGDGDFCAAVKAMQMHGVRVTVLSTTKTSPPMIANELRQQADAFVDVAAIMADVTRVNHRGESR